MLSTARGPSTACALALAALATAPAAAQDAPPPEEQISASGEALAKAAEGAPASDVQNGPGALSAADAAIGERQVFTPADFARYAPRTALDMLRNVPGFSIEGGGGGGFGGGGGGGGGPQRGLGQASGNVLVNGERLTSKSTDVGEQLTRIAARDVIRIEIVDGSTLNIAGLSGRVANVIARAGSVSGRFEWRPQASTGPAPVRWTEGDVSISGTRGAMAFTVSLRNNAFQGGSGGPSILTYPSGFVDTRYSENVSGLNAPTLGTNLRFTFGEVRANLNLSYGRRWFKSDEDEFRTDPALVPLVEEVRSRNKGYEYELSGDVEFPLGPGRLKLIALESYDTSTFRSQRILSIDDGRADTGNRFVRGGDEGERIGRAEYRWPMLGGDWQLSAEAAFNRLDNAAQLFVLNRAGEFVEIPFPAGTGGVREDRYESILSYSRPLSEALSLQLAAGGEHSTISQTGANANSRTFLRPKGTLNLTWAASERLNVVFELARRVGQLSFGDFLGSVNLSEDNENAGNNELRPAQSWEMELELTRRFGAWGTASLTLSQDWIEDYLTVIPIAGGESRGNVPSASVRAVSLDGTWRMDPLGFAGAKLDFDIRLEDSNLEDPVTGIVRAFDRARSKNIQLNFRHDVPRTDWAWGGEFRHSVFEPYFRVAEFGFDYNNPTFGAVFVEHKDVLGLTVRARAANLFKGDTVLNRWIYAGPRDTAALLYNENRRRAIGYVFNLTVSGSF